MAILTTDFKMVEDKRIGIGNILKRVPLGIFSGNKAENISATLSSVELSAAYTISGVLGGFISTAVTLTMLVFYDLRIAGSSLRAVQVRFSLKRASAS